MNRLFAVVGLATLMTSGLFAVPVAGLSAAATPTWWMVDTHQHSAFSGDARDDLGVAAVRAKRAGYNAVFVTDHDRAASFQIQGGNGNYLNYADSLSGRWIRKTTGSLSSSANSTVSTPVHSGSASLHLSAATASIGRAMVYAKRGPTLRAGGIRLDFWVYPQRIDAGSGVDVSMSLGGDSTTGAAVYGYTVAGTPPSPMVSKSTVLVWQLGSARAASQSGTTHVLVNTLQYAVRQWNHYVIDVRSGVITWSAAGSTRSSTGTGLSTLPAADQPVDYAAVGYPKLEASATGGTADAYFDDYTLSDTAPKCPAADFVYRNQLIDTGQFNGPNVNNTPFVLYPAREMGQNNHANQFNFDIKSPSDYLDTYNDTTVPAAYGNDGTLCTTSNTTAAPWKFSYYGTDNISAVQASGYPVQDNHPGVTDTTSGVVTTRAHGADAVEVRSGVDYSATWDAILRQNHQVVGTYGSDDHDGIGTGAPADFIDAPTPALDDLMRSYFEGRMYLAPNNFGGRIVFNLDGGARPFPARYPVYMSPGTATATARLSISAGLSTGQTIRWIYNSGAGNTIVTDSVNGASYSAAKTVPLSGAFTYLRAEVRTSAGTLLANTEPIFFKTISGLPTDKSMHVDSVTPTRGCKCSVTLTKGITEVSWGSTGLALTLTDPAGSTVNLVGTTARLPSGVTMDGSSIPRSSSLTAYHGASGDAWFYDSSSSTLLLQDQQSATSSAISIRF